QAVAHGPPTPLRDARGQGGPEPQLRIGPRQPQQPTIAGQVVSIELGQDRLIRRRRQHEPRRRSRVIAQGNGTIAHRSTARLRSLDNPSNRAVRPFVPSLSLLSYPGE